MAGARLSRRPTSADVARVAGLSRATVSYVLNDAPNQVIPEHTRRRVLDAAAELGYAPSAAARVLRRGRSDVVLCLLPDWPIGDNVGALLQHLSEALAARSLTFVVHPRGHDGRPVSEVWKAITPAVVVTFEDLPADTAATIRRVGIELTVALVGTPRRESHWLGLSEQRAGRLQVEHLAVRGHRHIGYAYPEDARVATFAGPRLEGVRLACADLGLAEPDIRTVALDPAAGAAAVTAWQAVDPAPTAICAYNDETALAVLAGARLTGVTVPDQLAVIGVDDIRAAALAAPPLTTVSVDIAALAGHLAETIVADLAGEPRPRAPGSDIHQVTVRESG